MIIGGIFFRSPDPEATAAWYRRHVGVPINEPPTIAHMRWNGADGAAGSTVWAPFPDDTGYFGDSGQPFMINYRVPDLDGARQSLRAAGVEVDDEVHSSPAGRFGWAADLDGRRFELWQPPAGD